ncbi:MAG: hypothetical protein ACI9K8_001156 [Reinekea sp.]|jgi:hypothetical protein
MIKTLITALGQVLVLLTLATGPLWAADSVGNAVAVIGSVSVVRSLDGVEESLFNNGAVFLNDRVLTGADGLVKLLLRDESILKISPNSEVSISAMIAGPGADGSSTVDLLKGKLRSVIGNKLGANTEFNINTPVAIAGVRGTDFEVVHLLRNGQWVTGVRCYDGAVELAVPGVSDSIGLLILPSQYSLASLGEPPSEPQTLSESDSLSKIMGADEAADEPPKDAADRAEEDASDEPAEEGTEKPADETNDDSNDQAIDQSADPASDTGIDPQSDNPSGAQPSDLQRELDLELQLDVQQVQSVLLNLEVGVDTNLLQVVDAILLAPTTVPQLTVQTLIDPDVSQSELLEKSWQQGPLLEFTIAIPMADGGVLP